VQPTLSPAEALNAGCACRTLNAERLHEQLEGNPDLKALLPNIAETRPHLFSSTTVFISTEVEQKITATVAAIERVVALPQYRALALARAPAIAGQDFGPVGVCMGLDFHLGEHGPQLIEINTNAGGALLNVALARAQEACCEPLEWSQLRNTRLDTLVQDIFDMFLAEWRLQRGDVPLHSVVIVDDNPSDQYLAPEFELFRQLFLRQGIAASIADPGELEWRDGRLWQQNTAVDMVYNRLTDFYLEEPGHQSLRDAYSSGAIVLTPHPRAHALHADKRNLVTLSNPELLESWGVSAPDRALLAATIPATELVTPEHAEDLWARRKQLFFKPVAGYGAKAAYRGDKLTRRVWGEILAGDFVAQALVPPGERLVRRANELADLKFDIRAYSYAGEVQLLAARMYAGQTTNFRTEGGGFAPVVVVPSL
jgi:hypothetical protein